MTKTDELNRAVAERLGWKPETLKISPFTGRELHPPIDMWRAPGKDCLQEHLPPFVTSRDTLHPVLEGMTEEEKQKFWGALDDQTHFGLWSDYHRMFWDILKASPAQLCTAFLAATNPEK